MAQALPPDPALDALLFKTSENKRSIPEAVFIGSVEEMTKNRELKVVLARIQELYTKYQYMQSSLLAQKSGLKNKLPDISSALETVQHLVAKRDKGDGEAAEYTYQLSENIFSKAVVEPTNTVCLWLGANVMMEYTLEEALELLKTNQKNAKETLSTVEEDLQFLRDQLTTTEVNIARVHNLGVKLRSKEKEAGTNDAAKPEESAAGAPTSFKPAARTEEKEKEKNYAFKQDADEVELSVPVPAGAQKSDIKVTILAESIKVEHSGKVVLEGQLAGKCSPNGSTWTMNKGKVEVTLEKADSTSWPSLFEKI